MKKIKIDRSNIVVGCVYLVVLLTTIIVSMFNVGLDLNQIMTSKYIGNLCLNFALAMIIVIAAMKDSENRELEKEYYKSAVHELLEILGVIKIKKLDSVFKFYTRKRFKDLREEYIADKLFQNGISKDIYNLNNKQLKDLIAGQELSRQQLNVIKELKSGKTKVREISSEEILNDYDKKLTYSEMRSNRGRIIASRIGPKFVMIFASSAIFTAAVFGSTGSSTGQILTDLITRLINIFTALLAGYLAGPELIQDKVNLKKLKGSFCREFIADFESGAFIPTETEMKETVIDTIKSSCQKSSQAIHELVEDVEEEIELTEEEVEQVKMNRKNKPST